jgi:hypothetical protein
MNGICGFGRVTQIALTIALTSVVTGLVASSVCDAGTRALHDKAYWRAVVADDYAPPAGAPLPPLTRELSAYLASTDAELRDDIAYSTLTQWLYLKRIVPPELRSELIAEWVANLQYQIGDREKDTVLRRSFSALMLAVAAALDNEAAYLDREGYKALLDAAMGYLQAEQDTRGFDADKGWLHSVAHSADLLKFLGRSRHLQKGEQAVILTGIADKLTQVDHVLVHGEDERLARAVVSIVARPDVDMPAFRAFLATLGQVRGDGLPEVADLSRNQNRKQLVVSLYAVLSTDSRDLASLRAAREMVLAELKTMM